MGEANLVNGEIDEVIGQFQMEGKAVEKKPYGNGHINDTFLVVCETPEGKKKRYILQKMNHSIFKVKRKHKPSPL